MVVAINHRHGSANNITIAQFKFSEGLLVDLALKWAVAQFCEFILLLRLSELGGLGEKVEGRSGHFPCPIAGISPNVGL